jgi:hypothetical protein
MRSTLSISPAATILPESQGANSVLFIFLHTLLRVFALIRNLTLLFSAVSRLLSEKHTGVGGPSDGSKFKAANVATFPSSVPLQPNALGATIGKGTRNLRGPGKQLRSSRCLRKESGHREGFNSAPGYIPTRSGLQVVPRSSVVPLDRAAGWSAVQQRAGKAGSVRMG